MGKRYSAFVEKFFDGREELWSKIKALQSRRNHYLLNQLKKDGNEINFYSWLAEVNVGLFFDPICDEIQYSPKLFGKTPDWRLSMNNQRIIAEVLRINPSEEETRYEIEKQKVIRAFQENNPGIPIITGSGGKVYDSRYFYGAQTKLDNKVRKYKDLLEQLQSPFLLGIAPDWNTRIEVLDASDFLCGSGNKGYFKENQDFGQYVSGVLFRSYWGTWTYFHNPGARFLLTSENEICIRRQI